MADPQSNAHARADAGAPTSGVIHIRTRLTANFTVIANDLAQRRGSAVTIGVAAYILSLPDGAPVSIAALCEHFTEGEILISRALRELETAGYLERRRERGPAGVIRTRTYFYDVPGTPAQARRPRAEATAEQKPAPTPTPKPAPKAAPATDHPAQPMPEADERTVAILASLRLADPRLVLSRRDVADLAPAVSEWLAAGVGPAQITVALTSGLPDRLRTRPARILAFRLSEPPLPAPTPTAAPKAPPAVPWRNCDDCERAIRPTGPGRLCLECRTKREASAAITSSEDLRAAC